jgi:hypothetical protein
MKETLQPKFANGQNVIWTNNGKSIEVTVSQGFVQERSRIGYHLAGYQQDTWAWEEELSEVGEEAQ